MSVEMSEKDKQPIEWNAENVLDHLNEFERKQEVTAVLDSYLIRIAKNGDIVFPWSKLKPVLRKKMETVLDTFSKTHPLESTVTVPNFEAFNFEVLKKTILTAVDSFTSAPFTIQRICELLTDPSKHYNRADKYMRGIEKNVLVVSTIEHRIGQGDGNANPVVNGLLNDSLRDDNDTMNGHENTEVVSSSNLNTPTNHVLLENFANVFPSAACIPSASNICISRDVDSNFLNSSECVESQEVELDVNPPLEELDSTTVKEEAMDTSEDEQTKSNSAADDSSEVSSSPSPPIESVEIEEKDKKEALPTVSVICNESGVDFSELVVESAKSAKNEAKCSEACLDIPLPDEETVKPSVISESDECQQDDTVSQSDDDSCTTFNIPVSEESSEVEVTTDDNVAATPEPLLIDSMNESKDSSDQCMELESSSENVDEHPA